MNDPIVTDPSTVSRTGRFPWLALSLAPVGMLISAIVAKGDWQAWTSAWAGVFSAGSMRSIGISLLLLVAALLLSATTALALSFGFGKLPAWSRIALAIPTKAMALFPIIALAWAFIGFWIGHQGWPIESLMPVEAPSLSHSMAPSIWKWSLPIFLLAVPITAEFLSCLLLGSSAKSDLLHRWLCLSRRLQFMSFMGTGYLLAIEPALDLPGAALPLAHALPSGIVELITSGVALGFALAAVACGLAWIFTTFLRPRPQAPVLFRLPASAAVMEGAIAIGLPRFEAWRRHLLPRRLHRGLSQLLQCSSWVVVWIILISSLLGRGPGAALAKAIPFAFTDPTAPLIAALPATLCALFLWLLGRIVAPRSNP